MECGHGVLEFYHGSLRGALKAGNVREFDKGMERRRRGKYQVLQLGHSVIIYLYFEA